MTRSSKDPGVRKLLRRLSKKYPHAPDCPAPADASDGDVPGPCTCGATGARKAERAQHEGRPRSMAMLSADLRLVDQALGFYVSEREGAQPIDAMLKLRARVQAAIKGKVQ